MKGGKLFSRMSLSADICTVANDRQGLAYISRADRLIKDIEGKHKLIEKNEKKE